MITDVPICSKTTGFYNFVFVILTWLQSTNIS